MLWFPPLLTFSPLFNMRLQFSFAIVAAADDAHLAAIGAALLAAVTAAVNCPKNGAKEDGDVWFNKVCRSTAVSVARPITTRS